MASKEERDLDPQAGEQCDSCRTTVLARQQEHARGTDKCLLAALPQLTAARHRLGPQKQLSNLLVLTGSQVSSPVAMHISFLSFQFLFHRMTG